MRLGKWEELTKLKEVIPRRADAINLNIHRDGKYAVSVDNGNHRYLFSTHTDYDKASKMVDWLGDYVNPHSIHNNVTNYHYTTKR